MTSPEPGEYREFSAGDRHSQMLELATSCERMGRILAAHGDVHFAAMFRCRAQFAEELIRSGYVKSDLDALGGSLPSGPEWLNPKAVDFGGRREPWHAEVAELHARALGVAARLRAVALWHGA
ncbi:hypothetical protein [Pseudactinotalea suaedae]|uniref:hypothetical protein n=1 Tax=Pseudactinotalea suaedae TaxID=1524924 RepID=UPI0012E29097|nr:hypothetical protein [Pseudactinotalea suaedae]